MVDKKNAVLILCVIIILVTFGIVVPAFLSKKVVKNDTVVGSINTVDIDYTDSGFSPRSIKIKAGTTVSWANKSSKPMWVASDPHPAHNFLPGFDETETILPAPQTKSGFVKTALAHDASLETYQYNFIEIGKWTYHNHIYPKDKGEIIVTE